jgi:hypothetical protein
MNLIRTMRKKLMFQVNIFNHREFRQIKVLVKHNSKEAEAELEKKYINHIREKVKNQMQSKMCWITVLKVMIFRKPLGKINLISNNTFKIKLRK